jgi:hypothetical protein
LQFLSVQWANRVCISGEVPETVQWGESALQILSNHRRIQLRYVLVCPAVKANRGQKMMHRHLLMSIAVRAMSI